MVVPCLGEIGQGVNRESILALIRTLCRSAKMSVDEVSKLTIDEAMDLYDSFLSEAPSTIAPEGNGKAPVLAASGDQPPPPPDSSLTASGKAIAAAYELLSEGKVVTIAAAAKRAGVNRSNVYAYPEAIRLIRNLATPNGRPPRGSKDRDTGKLEAWDNDT